VQLAERLDECVASAHSLLCVGLDPDGADGAPAAERFCIEILEATLDVAAAVKANLAFFEQFGSAGYAVLERLRGRVPADRLLILDGKRGDIANTSEAYARALFGVLGADAVTVNPLLGRDAVSPFLAKREYGVFLVARSSNPGAADLLDVAVAGGGPLHARIVELGLAWDPGGQVGFVVGATDPGAVAGVRAAAGDAPLLVPGVGAQGGALEEAVLSGLDGRRGGLLISVSRGIAAAPEGPARAAAELRARIEAARGAVTLA
jgi:orotidine 5'-phosphate decarboxylase subfamily 2